MFVEFGKTYSSSKYLSPFGPEKGKNIFKEENGHNNIIIKIFLSYRSDLIFKSSYMEGKAKISIIFKSEWEKARTKRAV